MKVVDMHCDTISEIYLKRQSGQDISLKHNDLHLSLDTMKQGDYLLQNFAMFTPLHKTCLLYTSCFFQQSFRLHSQKSCLLHQVLCWQIQL